MENILIDTCSWIDLLTEDQNKLLPHLEFWTNNNCINIITHEIIIEEWEKHKEKQKKRFTESIKTKIRHTKEISKRENLDIPEFIEPNIKNIESQISIIDNLIRNAFVLATADDIKIFCSDRTITKKAPFHNKLDSTKDAYIIFSALKHFSSLNENLILISSNKEEFGSPRDLERELHPELLENYTNINVNYYNDIGRAISDLKHVLPISLITNDSTIKLSESEDDIYIDRTKPILDQIYDYVIVRHKELNFVPIPIYTRHYPFKDKSDSFPYYSIFNLSTDNQDFFNLMKSIKISDTKKIELVDDSYYINVSDPDSKLKTILTSLSQNLIFNISSNTTRDRATIRYTETKSCNCPNCSFRKFKFEECFKSLNSYSEKPEDLLKLAYLHYQIGNYIKSSEILKQAYTKSTNSKLLISAFITQFNLSKLYVFIRNNYFGNDSQPELLSELKNIDLANCARKLSVKENKKVIEWIRDNKFYTESVNSIQSLTTKIIDHYNSQLNGGWSSNNDVWTLINEYASIDAFLNDNYIIYDNFKEFHDLSVVFLEGLFASHAIKESQHSRLEEFDDWLIIQILNYNDADTINKLFNRYKLKKIKYKETASSGDSFKVLIDNFFKVNLLIRDSFSEFCEENNRKFWDYYNQIFNNILTLVSICDFDNAFYKAFAEKLLTYLKSEKYIYYYNTKYVKTFLFRVGDKIDYDTLKGFFLLAIDNSKYHNEDFYDTISDIFLTRKEKLIISQAQFDLVKNISFENCEKCKEKHTERIIIPIYNILDDEHFKKEISLTIKQQLEKQFSFELYYLATLYDIIDFEVTIFKQALNASFPNDKRVSFRSFFSDDEENNRFDKVNHIINLCFKFSIDTSDEEFQRFKELDNYYLWLLDMDRFNYDNFMPTWIGEYPTMYYYRKIGKNLFVKEKLERFLKDNFDSNIERDYINIFVRKTWDKETEETTNR